MVSVCLTNNRKKLANEKKPRTGTYKMCRIPKNQYDEAIMSKGSSSALNYSPKASNCSVKHENRRKRKDGCCKCRQELQ